MRAWMPAVTGGVLVGVGAALPWLSLFAGLQSYSGLVGLYGRLLIVGAALAVAGGARQYRGRCGTGDPARIRPDRGRVMRDRQRCGMDLTFRSAISRIVWKRAGGSVIRECSTARL